MSFVHQRSFNVEGSTSTAGVDSSRPSAQHDCVIGRSAQRHTHSGKSGKPTRSQREKGCARLAYTVPPCQRSSSGSLQSTNVPGVILLAQDNRSVMLDSSCAPSRCDTTYSDTPHRSVGPSGDVEAGGVCSGGDADESGLGKVGLTNSAACNACARLGSGSCASESSGQSQPRPLNNVG